jgi:HEAT repeat protein
LKEPISAEISSIKSTHVDRDQGTRTTVVRLDVGSADGVFVNMEFCIVEPPGLISTADVKSVGAHSAEAVIWEIACLASVPPAVGWKLSTRPDHRESKAALSELTDAIQSNNAAAFRRAIQLIQELGRSDEAIPILIEALNRASVDIRARAAVALGQLASSAKATPILTRIVNDTVENRKVRRAARHALKGLAHR